jgi:RNA polymerase sigma-70 factor (ECF subfamily)
MSDRIETSALVELVRAGDEAALGALFDAEVDAVYSFVLPRLGRDEALAADVVQETFLLALAKLDSYDSARASFATWLCLLSRNVIRRELRARRREDVGRVTGDVEARLERAAAALGDEPLPPDLLDASETRSSVALVLGQLPSGYREALTRKYVDGATLEELAQELSMTAVAAKSLLSRARATFRDLFLAASLP